MVLLLWLYQSEFVFNWSIVWVQTFFFVEGVQWRFLLARGWGSISTFGRFSCKTGRISLGKGAWPHLPTPAYVYGLSLDHSATS